MKTTYRTYDEIVEAGRALAESSHAFGERLTDAQEFAHKHELRFGSDSYPLVKLGRHWTFDHAAVRSAPLFATKRKATEAWEVLIVKWRHMSALSAAARQAVQS